MKSRWEGEREGKGARLGLTLSLASNEITGSASELELKVMWCRAIDLTQFPFFYSGSMDSSTQEQEKFSVAPQWNKQQQDTRFCYHAELRGREYSHAN